MKIQCPGCQAGFSLPDEKIPEGKAVRVLCPKCKTPIEIKESASFPAEEKGDKKTESPCSAGSWSPESASEETPALDVVEEGVDTALLCVSDPSRVEKLERILREMDFRVFRGCHASSAVSKIQHNSYSIILVDESFDEGMLTQNLVLEQVQLLPMDMRRQMFVCLLSESLPTLDQLTAFRLGVDMILNFQDLLKSKIILNRAMKEHFVLYRIYKEELNRRT